ncbi:MAG: FG-GAP-like repeat-containing protein [Cyclobacteriaceae bacterium]
MRRTKLLLIVVTLLFTASSSVIGQDLWNALNGPFGGNVKDIERASNGKLYIATEFGGYSSIDDGATWDRISGITNFDVRDFEISPTTGRIHAVCGSSTSNYFFSDDGINWSSGTITGSGNSLKIGVHPANADIVFVLSNNLLFRSSNGGSSWSQNSFVFPDILTGIEINSAGVVMVVCQSNSVYRSLFGGATWSGASQVTIDGSTTRNIRSVATFNDKFYVSGFDNTLYKSNDGSSNSWTSVITGTFTETGLLNTGVIGFNSSGKLYLAVDHGFWICDDPTIATPVWTRQGNMEAFGLQKVIAGANDDIFVASSTHSLVKSTDLGVNWAQAVNGITSVQPLDILETTDGRILVADNIGFYISQNQGQTWQINNSPSNNSTEYFRKLVELDDASILLLSGYGARRYEGSDVLTIVGGTPEWIPNFAFSRTTTPGNYIIIGATPGQNIYRSTDGAASWSLESYSGLPGSFFTQQIEIEDQTKYADEGYLYLRTSANQLYRVKEGTDAAELITLPVAGFMLDMHILDAKDQDVLYLLIQNGTSYTIAYSDDHGDNWETVTPPELVSSQSQGFSVLTDNSVEYKGENMLSVFANGGKVFISYDNGLAWMSETHAAPRAVFRKIIITDDNYGYLDGQGLRLRRSSRPMFIPAKPTNFKVENFTFNRAAFSWVDNSSLEEVYVLEVSIGNNTSYQTETESGTNSTNVLLTNLLPNTTYFFRVSAKGPGGNSPSSNEISFTTLDNACGLVIPENRSWTSTVQRSRGPNFASLSPAVHIDPDQPYTLTFDATGTELQGAAKVYAHAGVITVDKENPIKDDPTAPWQYVVGNWGADDGLGQMTNVGGEIWQITLNSTLRNYFSVPGGTKIYWLAAVFRNADGSAYATNNGVDQDVFISIEKGFVDNAVAIDILDATTRRYGISTLPNQFFEACNVISTLSPGEGTWDGGNNTANFNWELVDTNGYTTYYSNTSVINVSDPLPPTPDGLKAYAAGAKKNLLKWNKTDYSSSYKIQRGVGTFTCPSDIGGTGIAYETTNMFFGNTYETASLSDPGPKTGTIDILPTSPGAATYTISDYSFGWYTVAAYLGGPPGGGPPPPIGSFLLTHDCRFLSAFGGSIGESDWTYTIKSISPTELVFDWFSVGGLDGGTTKLMRSDGKSWLAQLTQDYSLPEIAQVDYPNLNYVDNDPGLVEGQVYTYRVAAVNSAGTSLSSKKTEITTVTPLFEPQLNELNEVSFDGQGIASADLNGDGFDDLIMPTLQNQFNEPVVPLVFKNNGNGSYTKIEIPSMGNEAVSGYRGCTISDFNDDGLPDILYMRTNQEVNNAVLKDVLLLNDGNFQFTKTKIVSRPGYANQFASETSLDITGDGKLDLVTVSTGGGGLDPQPSFVLSGNGDGSFSQITGAGTITTDFINGIDVSTSDYDNDGDFDIMLLDRSSSVPVRLYRNNSDNTFSRISGLDFDANISSRWRTSSWGDIDNDGDMDVFVGSQNPGQARHLYRNNGEGTFTRLLTSAVSENSGFCYGSAFGDIDNDGDLDLVTVGFGFGDARIYFNTGDGTFTQYTTIEALNSPYQSNLGVALSDTNNDGFLDVVPGTYIGLPLTVFRNAAKGVASNKWIKFKLNGTTSNKSAIGARIKVTTGVKNQIREISGRTGYGSQSSLTQHFGVGSASIVNQVVITWPSGNVMTLNNLAVNQLYEIDEDLTGPTLVSLSPANVGNGIAIDAKLVITYNEPPAGVTDKNIKVFKSDNLTTPIATIDAGTGVVTGNAISFTLPAPLELFTNYSVVVDAGAITDRFQNVAENITAWSFQTADNTPPQVSFTEVPLVNKGFSSTTFTVTATDNSDVSTVVMTYRGMTSKTTGTLNGTKTGNDWTFTVSESIFDAMGLEYFFTAKDPSDNETRSPSDATQYYRTRFNLPAGSEPQLSVVGSNGNVTGYRIISIPYELANNGIGENFEELGGADPKKFRFIRYHETPSPGWDEYPGSLNTLAI